MSPEEKELLKRSVELGEENNKMLHKMRSIQKWAAFWRTLKMVLIIAIAVGSFYYVEPYLNKVLNLYNSVTGIEKNLNNSPIQNFLKNVKN